MAQGERVRGYTCALMTCEKTRIAAASLRSVVSEAPAWLYSASEYTRDVEGCTRTSIPEETSRCTCEGVSAARRSHLEYLSASRPIHRRAADVM
eukprot:scaffold15594_cov63-Phaeocystis_antarctica.AAC.2